MAIDYNIFWRWITKKLGEDNCIKSGEEICINSPFTDDKGFHCWCNTKKGVFHCWKTDESGSLYNLVMELEGCNYLDAKDILGEDQLLADLEAKVASFFVKEIKVEKKEVFLELPKDSLKISNLSKDNKFRIISEKYLSNRKLPIDDLYVCISGKYAMRIIIPYYDNKGNLIYFNGRDITGKSKLRYRGPEKELGIGKNEVVWIKHWPKEGETVYLTEGEFDAMSLWEAGFNGAAIGGKNFTNNHLQLLKAYDIILCFDLDKSGLEALNKIRTFVRKHQFVRGSKHNKIGFVQPAKGTKDWNEMLVKYNKEVIHGYITKYQQFLDQYSNSIFGI